VEIQRDFTSSKEGVSAFAGVEPEEIVTVVTSVTVVTADLNRLKGFSRKNVNIARRGFTFVTIVTP
jgi:hypothetical protein